MMFKKNNNARKMTRIEKDNEKKINSNKKAALKLRKELATTLNWMDIQSVNDDCIIIGKDKGKKLIVKGIKLTPHNIFLDEPVEQAQWIEGIRFALNNIDSELFFSFVYSPVNLDKHINILNNELMVEDDPTCKAMIQDDLEKAYSFQKTHKEKEFFLMIRDTDDKRLQKNLSDLFDYWYRAGFSPSILNQRDFYSYLMFTFENTLINDYVFSRGLFTSLNMDVEYDEQQDKYITVDTTNDFHQYGEPIYNIRQDANLIQRSKLAPTGLKVNRNNIEIGDVFIKELLVTSLPPEFYLAALTSYLNDPNVKVYMKLNRSKTDLTRMLNKDYQKKLEQLQRSKDETEKQRLIQSLQTQKEYINDVVRKNDITHNTMIVFQVKGSSIKELNERVKRLKDRLQTEGWSVIMANGLQEQLFRVSTPLFLSSKLEPVIEENLGVPLTSDSVAGLYPFIFETLQDNNGLLLGEELQNGGKILLDPFYYIHNSNDARFNNRVNGNMIIAGRAGSGKTTAMNLITRNCIKNKTLTVWVDPENKNEKLTKHYGGTYIDWGKRGNIINPFDLKPISFDPDDDDPHIEEKMWDTQLAINFVIDDIKQIFQYLFPSITDDEKSCLGSIVNVTYGLLGITKDKNGKYKSFKGMTYEQMPTFTTFNDAINVLISIYSEKPGGEEDVRIYRSISRKVQSILNEWSVYLNGHTTVKPSNADRNIISFGTKKLQTVSNELQEALYHIMFTYSWTLCLDETCESAFIIDEAHTLILKGNLSSLVAQFVRRSRKYKNLMLIATQEPRDFADDRVLTDGKAIFNNSVYKIVLGLNKDATNDLKKLENINKSEDFWIQRFGQGDALLICGNRRIPIHIDATRAELAEMGAMFQ